MTKVISYTIKLNITNKLKKMIFFNYFEIHRKWAIEVTNSLKRRDLYIERKLVTEN